MSSLAVVQNSNGAITTQGAFSREQIETIKNVICKGSSDDELRLFMAITERTGLDPFARQIFAVKRKEKNSDGQWRDALTVQVSIDGLRLVAQRTGKYRGQVGPYWCGKDGVWKDVWLEDEPPAAAKVGVRHADFPEPLYRVALFKSYKQTTSQGALNHIWGKFPELMIAKCAEALALRSAFPQELSGLYTADEMGNSAEVQTIDVGYEPSAQQQPKPQPQQPSEIDQLRQQLKATVEAKGWVLNEVSGWIKEQCKTRYGKDVTSQCTPDELKDLIQFVASYQPPQQSVEAEAEFDDTQL